MKKNFHVVKFSTWFAISHHFKPRSPFSGTFAVIFYAVNVFSDILKDPSESSETKEKDRLTPYYAAILVGLIRLAGTVLGTRSFKFVLQANFNRYFLGTALIKRFPRKTLMVSSAIMMALFMTTLGLNEFYLERVGIKDAVKAISNATGDEETFANATTEAMASHEVYSRLIMDNLISSGLYFFCFSGQIANATLSVRSSNHFVYAGLRNWSWDRPLAPSGGTLSHRN